MGPLVALRLPTFLMETGPEVHQSHTRLLLFGRPEGRYPVYAPQMTAPRWARFLPERQDLASTQLVTLMRTRHECVSGEEDLPAHAALEPVLQGPPRPLGHMLALAAKGRLLEVWLLGGVDFHHRPCPWRVPQCSDAPIVQAGALSDRPAPSWDEFAIHDQASRTQCHELCPSE